MKINQSTFFAFRILYRLYQGKDRMVTSKEIAEMEELSQGVVLKILQKLSRVGICYVQQGRGAVCGGFTLAKSIDEITVFEILKTMEGVDICINLDAAYRKKEKQMFLVCSRMNDELEELLSKYTVRSLFESDKAGVF